MKIKSLEKERERKVKRIKELAKEIRKSGIMDDYFDNTK